MTRGKLHFINRIDRNNVGDRHCCPLPYFFRYFQQYNIMRHDIDFIDWLEIDREDVVIIGGGGLVNVAGSFNSAINKLLDKCEHVIGWGIGFNTHNERWFNGHDFETIDFSRFRLVAIRDHNHPSHLRWSPCPSALALTLDRKIRPKRDIGVIEHMHLPIRGLPHEKISNAFNLQDVSRFILESEVVVTNSYHITYWASLLERKAIVFHKFSNKFDYFKYKPEFIDNSSGDPTISVIEEAADRTKIYDGALEEAVSLNKSFFEEVKSLIDSSDIVKGNEYQRIYQITKPQLWNDQHERRSFAERLSEVEQTSACEKETSRKLIQDIHADLHLRVDREGVIIHERISEREQELRKLIAETKSIVERQGEEISQLQDLVTGMLRLVANSSSSKMSAAEEHSQQVGFTVSESRD